MIAGIATTPLAADNDLCGEGAGLPTGTHDPGYAGSIPAPATTCSVESHAAISADPERFAAELHGHQPWPGLGEMAHCRCGSTLTREIEAEAA